MSYHTRSRSWRWLAFAALLAWGLLAGAQTHEVTTATQLRATPALNSMVVQQLPAGTPLQGVQTRGGWLKVQAGEQQGWVRLTHVRTMAARAPAASGNPLASLFTGAGNQPTATTGTRGLTQEELASAQPAPQEVRRLEQHAVSAREAQQFARSGKLAATAIADYDGAAQ